MGPSPSLPDCCEVRGPDTGWEALGGIGGQALEAVRCRRPAFQRLPRLGRWSRKEPGGRVGGIDLTSRQFQVQISSVSFARSRGEVSLRGGRAGDRVGGVRLWWGGRSRVRAWLLGWFELRAGVAVAVSDLHRRPRPKPRRPASVTVMSGEQRPGDGGLGIGGRGFRSLSIAQKRSLGCPNLANPSYQGQPGGPLAGPQPPRSTGRSR
jgi:hypothetical protein